MSLNPAFSAIALSLQEAATSLTLGDIQSRLSDCLRDKVKNTGAWCYLVDVYGDDESGDVIYSLNGDLCKASYQMGTVDGKPSCDIETDNAVDVVARTTYEEEAEDEDHMTSMSTEAYYVSRETVPVYERFISKDERKKADSGSFAGKGKSFPILKPEDVGAAAQSLGRAGTGNFGTGTIKANIIRIAKAKGWSGSLPKAWQDGDSKEAAKEITIDGEFVALKEGAVGQDGTAYLKLIAPGKGSSGFYPADVLERDGPTVFPKGTKNFWNHQTDAEEASRPEGDLRDLASVLTEDAHYERKGPAGPGLYAKANVFEQFRQPVDDLAKHIGMSIRATGKAKEGKVGDYSGPIIQELTKGISVDYVTTPGAGGKVLQLFEAARAAKPVNLREGGADTDMDAADLKTLKEAVDELKALRETTASQAVELRRLKERGAIADAATEAAKYFQGVTVAEAIQKRVLGRVLSMTIPLTEAGELDKVKLTEMVEAETKSEVAYIAELTGNRVVTGMGGGSGAELTEAQKSDHAKAIETEMKESAARLGFSGKGAEIFNRGRQAYDPNYRVNGPQLVDEGEVA